jgi:radical SAM protein with 4Fe4S-binding SPASM domain
MKLEELFVPHKVVLELTTDCNMRCVYCAVSDKGYHGYHMSDEIFEKCLKFLDAFPAKIVNMSGHGETTYIPDWQEKAERLLARGHDLMITTNCAVPLTWSEALTLAQFYIITFSIDTIDAKLLKKLRRKVDIRTFSYNINIIKAAAMALGRKPPTLKINCVLSDLTIVNLSALIPFAAAHADYMNIQPMTELYLETDPQPKSIFNLEGEQLEAARAEYKKAMEVAGRLREQTGFQVGTFNLLANFLSNENIPEMKRHIKTQFEGQTADYAKMALPMQDGETRYCRDPWSNIVVQPNGNLRFCCESMYPWGNVKDIECFQQALAGKKAKEFKKALLTGKNVESDCETCTIRTNVPTVVLERDIKSIFVPQQPQQVPKTG